MDLSTDDCFAFLTDKLDLPMGSIRGVFSVETGGFNSCTSLAVAADLDIPVVDCDTMGRSFPEIQVIIITHL